MIENMFIKQIIIITIKKVILKVMNIIENEIPPFWVKPQIARRFNSVKSDERISYPFLDSIHGLCLDGNEI
jgi:hypothetical protein